MKACFYFHIFKQAQIFFDFLYHLVNKEQLLDKINFLFPGSIPQTYIDKKHHSLKHPVLQNAKENNGISYFQLYKFIILLRSRNSTESGISQEVLGTMELNSSILKNEVPYPRSRTYSALLSFCAWDVETILSRLRSNSCAS